MFGEEISKKSPLFSAKGGKLFVEKIGFKIFLDFYFSKIFYHCFAMTNRLISAKNVCFDFVEPFDFTANFLVSPDASRGERTNASGVKKSQSPVWCVLFEHVRTFFERRTDAWRFAPSLSLRSCKTKFFFNIF